MKFNLSLFAVFLAILLASCTKESTTEPIFDNTELTNAALLTEINFARTNPNQYAQLLRERIGYFEGNLYSEPGKTSLQTHEGVAAYQEAIAFLESASPKPLLSLSSGLSKSCADHVADLGPKGGLSHESSNGDTPWDRMARYGKASGNLAENIAFGPATAREAIIQLIVDDGVSNRGHRINIFDSRLLIVGFAAGNHSVYSTMIVMDFASAFTDY